MKLFRVAQTFLITVFLIGGLFGGDANAQYLECNTPISVPDSLVLGGKAPAYASDLNYLKIRCFIHVLQESNGTGGLNQIEIDGMVEDASDDFETINITLEVVGQDTVANSLYFSDPDYYYSDIFNESPHSDSIDIYLGPSTGAAKGRAQGVPGSSLILSGSLSSNSALSHVLGNCLGLYETDETNFGVENPDGSNSGSTGDMISDTAADPGLYGCSV